jgi:anti-sigma regulatory factor (Ser/Thr protein kinase)
VYLLAELLNNAIVYSSPTAPVLVRAVAGPDAVEVRIEDSGIGIAPELLQRLNAVLRGPTPDVVVTNQMGLPGVAQAAASLDW